MAMFEIFLSANGGANYRCSKLSMANTSYTMRLEGQIKGGEMLRDARSGVMFPLT